MRRALVLRGGGTAGLLGGRPRDFFISIAESVSPFVKEVLGLKMVKAEPGNIEMEMALKPQFIGNPFSAALHGGVAAAAADHVAGFAAWSSLADPNLVVSTVDLRLDYLQPATFTAGDYLHISGKVLNDKGGGGRLLRADAEVRNSKNELLVCARGTFNVYKLTKE